MFVSTFYGFLNNVGLFLFVFECSYQIENPALFHGLNVAEILPEGS